MYYSGDVDMSFLFHLPECWTVFSDPTLPACLLLGSTVMWTV